VLISGILLLPNESLNPALSYANSRYLYDLFIIRGIKTFVLKNV